MFIGPSGSRIFSILRGDSNMKQTLDVEPVTIKHSSVVGALGFEPRSAGLFPVLSSSHSS